MIVKADGKPYATYESAKQQLSAKGLGDTHEVVGHRGGYGIAPRDNCHHEASEPGVYAVPQVNGCDITAGKMYEVVSEDGSRMFYVDDDKGYRIACLWDGCAHLGGGNWERVEMVTLRPGDHVPTKGMTEDQYHAVAEAFMAAGCRRDHWDDVPGKQFGDWDYLAWGSAGDVLGTNDAEGDTYLPSSRRRLTISQVLSATNAKRQDEPEEPEEPEDQQGEPCPSVLDALRLAQQRVNELSHELSIAQGVRDEALEAVRAELGEGFEISVVEGVPTGVDMSDPSNWREGDLLEALPGVNRTDIHAGGVYEFLQVDNSGEIRVKADDAGDSNWCHARDIKFHSRPTK